MMVFSEFHSTFIVGDGKRGKTRKTLPMKKWEVWVFPAFAATGIHAVVSHAVGGWTVEERSQRKNHSFSHKLVHSGLSKF